MSADPAWSGSPEPAPADDSFDLQQADRLVRDLFSVSLALSSAQSLTEGLMSIRLGQVVDDLDAVVGQLRHAAFTAQCAKAAPPQPLPDPSDDDARPHDTAPGPVERTTNALSQVEHVLITLWADISADTASPQAQHRIIEATRLMRSAMIALDARAVG